MMLSHVFDNFSRLPHSKTVDFLVNFWPVFNKLCTIVAMTRFTDYLCQRGASVHTLVSRVIFVTKGGIFYSSFSNNFC